MNKPLGYYVSQNDKNKAILDDLESQLGSFFQGLTKTEKALIIYKISLTLFTLEDDQNIELHSVAGKLQRLDYETRLDLVKFLANNLE